MAGIGFELRKAMSSSSGLKRSGGYFSAAFTCFGGMLIGIVLLSVIQIAASAGGITQDVRDLFMSYITNAMFISMLVASVLSQVVSRYVSDMLFEGRYEAVMPSLAGCGLLTLAVGSIIFGGMMAGSDLPLTHAVYLMLLFEALSLCWVLMNYISLLRDYRQVTLAFVAALGVAGLAVLVIGLLGMMTPENMLLTLVIAYGTVDALLFRTLYRGFPTDEGGLFDFLKWLRRNPALAVTGLLMEVGLLGHFWLTWFLSPQGMRLQGVFACSPSYDFPAIVAYFCTIPAMVYFIAMFETDFYRRYHSYLSELAGGRTGEVDTARDVMLSSIRRGVSNFAAVQIISCLLFITIGAKILSVMNIGMTETMLDAFRMFCVGYSLYAIGNVLMLLQMYFVNERRSALASGVFAAAVAGMTLLDIHLNGRATGLGLCAGALLLVVVSALQLVRCLDNLEYHILCESAQELLPVRVKAKKPVGSWLREASPAKLRALGAGALAVCLAVVGVSAGSLMIQARRASLIRAYTPEQSEKVLLSPGMGYAPWANAEETENLQTSLVYVELRWADWEPEEGVYNLDFMEEEFNLSLYRAQERQVVFRFICDEPTGEDHIDIPLWLYERTGDGQHYMTDYGMGYSPNYANEDFITAHERAIAALGVAFGGDDFFHYVELGSLGHWGEYHVNLSAGLNPLPLYDTRVRYIAPYLTAFPDAHFMTRYPLLETTKYGFGLYNDMTGDASETEYWLSQMVGGVWEQTGMPEQGYCVDAWQSAPVAGEYASMAEDSFYLHDNLSVTLELLRKSHQSIIGPKIIVDESDMDFTAASESVLKTIGYRYTATGAVIDVAEEETVRVSVTLTNLGCAPVYDPCTVTLMVYDQEEELMWTQTMADADLRKLLPGTEMTVSAAIPRDGLDDDETYKLCIAIDDESGERFLPMALALEVAPLEYQLAQFSIER